MTTLLISSSDDTTWRVVAKDGNPTALRNCPERRQSEQWGEWFLKATDMTVATIQQSKYSVEWQDEFSQAQHDEIVLRTALSERIREQTAAYKTTRVAPINKFQFINEEVADYQLVAATNAFHSNGYGLFMEQGTGKTLPTITVMDNLPRRADGKPPLYCVVAPNNVRYNWESEVKRWSKRDPKVSVIRGGQVRRLERLVEVTKDDGQDYSLAILGYDSIAGMWEYMHFINWDLGVLDESHYVKGAKTNRWSYIAKLRDKCNKRMALTGTPIANTIIDLYTQLEWMGEGYSGFIDHKSFKKFYDIYDKDIEGDQGERLVGLQNVPFMKDRLSRYSFVVTKKEVLKDLPDKQYDAEEVEMSKPQQEAYDKMATELSIAIDGKDDSPLAVNSILVQLLKLSQITSGHLVVPEVLDGEGAVVEPKKHIDFSPNPKLDRLREMLLEKTLEDKTIIWAHYITDIKKIVGMCRVEGIDCVEYYGSVGADARKEAERRFNEDNNCKVFVGNPAAGGTGINLLGYPPGKPELTTTNANHVIYYSQDWSSLKRSQSEDRCHRRGTREPVRITDLVIPETIDTTIRERVTAKRVAAMEITDVKDILREVLNRG